LPDSFAFVFLRHSRSGNLAQPINNPALCPSGKPFGIREPGRTRRSQRLVNVTDGRNIECPFPVQLQTVSSSIVGTVGSRDIAPCSNVRPRPAHGKKALDLFMTHRRLHLPNCVIDGICKALLERMRDKR